MVVLAAALSTSDEDSLRQVIAMNEVPAVEVFPDRFAVDVAGLRGALVPHAEFSANDRGTGSGVNAGRLTR